jgi:hypothetical protein
MVDPGFLQYRQGSRCALVDGTPIHMKNYIQDGGMAYGIHLKKKK